MRKYYLCFFLAIGILNSIFFSNIDAKNNDHTIKNNHLKISFNPKTGAFLIDVLDKNGLLVSQTAASGFTFDGMAQLHFKSEGNDTTISFYSEKIKLQFQRISQRAISIICTTRDEHIHDIDFTIDNDERGIGYYGGGERFNTLSQEGYILPMHSTDRVDNKAAGSHKPVPFIMSTSGYGIFVDSYYPGYFDLFCKNPFQFSVKYRTKQLKLVLMGGPSLKELLTEFSSHTGRSCIPPQWAFGLWKSRDVHHNQDSVYLDIENHRKLDIPASVIVLDSPWEKGYNDFEINPVQFKNHEKMLERIEELGFRLCLWLTPHINFRNRIDMVGIDSVSSSFKEAKDKGYLVTTKDGKVAVSEWWKGEGGLIDFTNPEAIEWWHQQLLKTKEYGAHAFKCDDGEGNFVPDAVFHDGTPSIDMQNKYCMLYNRAMQDYIDKYLDGNGTLIVRSGFTGVQKTSFSWGADNAGDFSFEDGLPSVILAAQTSALSGIPLWGSDIAGYMGIQTPELFIRWTQFSTFCPFMQVHMKSNKGPWDYGNEILNIFRKYAKIRIQLFPYLYNIVHEAAKTGIPIIRPMVLEFQDDVIARQKIYQYLFGSDLLIAPIYQPGNYRNVYIPEGTWYDYWTKEAFIGPKNIDVHAPLDNTPVFVREGAIIPMLPDDIQTLVERHDKMSTEVKSIDNRRIIQIWPGENGFTKTYDGLTIASSNDGKELIVEIGAKQETEVEIELISIKAKCQDSQVSCQFNTEANLTTCKLGLMSKSETFRFVIAR